MKLSITAPLLRKGNANYSGNSGLKSKISGTGRAERPDKLGVPRDIVFPEWFK